MVQTDLQRMINEKPSMSDVVKKAEFESWKQESQTKQNGFVTMPQLDTKLNDYVMKSDINNQISSI